MCNNRKKIMHTTVQIVSLDENIFKALLPLKSYVGPCIR